MVQTVLQTGNRSYRVYFIENEEDLALKTFSSIAVFKEERSSESYGQSQQQQVRNLIINIRAITNYGKYNLYIFSNRKYGYHLQ